MELAAQGALGQGLLKERLLGQELIYQRLLSGVELPLGQAEGAVAVVVQPGAVHAHEQARGRIMLGRHGSAKISPRHSDLLEHAIRRQSFCNLSLRPLVRA
jgi:hypothetical protein